MYTFFRVFSNVCSVLSQCSSRHRLLHLLYDIDFAHTNWLTDWVTDPLTDWLTDRSTDWLTDWPIDWLTEWPTDWPADWVTDLLIDWLAGWLSDWPINWLAGWPIGHLADWLADWLSNWLMEKLKFDVKLFCISKNELSACRNTIGIRFGHCNSYYDNLSKCDFHL